MTFTGPDLAAPATIVPPALTASVDDYGPNGGRNATTWRLTSTTSVTITGIVAGNEGDTRRLVNAGSNPIILADASPSSAAANRLNLGANVPLPPGATISLYYPFAAAGWSASEADVGLPVADGLLRGQAAVIAATGINSLGAIGLTPAAGGTLTTRNVAATSLFTRTRRTGIVSASSSGSLSYLRHGSTTLLTGNGSLGGFRWVARFGCSDAATVAGARQFAGVSSATGAPSDVEPATLTNCIGVGHGAADTNLKVYYGAGSAGTPIDLGVDFPANTLSVDLYEVELVCPSTGGAQYMVTRLNTGHYASGSLASSQIPSSTTGLSPCTLWRSNNATALAVGLDLVTIYVETH